MPSFLWAEAFSMIIWTTVTASAPQDNKEDKLITTESRIIYKFLD